MSSEQPTAETSNRKTKYTSFRGALIQVDVSPKDDTLILDFINWQCETARFPLYTAYSSPFKYIAFFLEDDVAAVEKWLKERMEKHP